MTKKIKRGLCGKNLIRFWLFCQTLSSPETKRARKNLLEANFAFLELGSMAKLGRFAS